MSCKFCKNFYCAILKLEQWYRCLCLFGGWIFSNVKNDTDRCVPVHQLGTSVKSILKLKVNIYLIFLFLSQHRFTPPTKLSNTSCNAAANFIYKEKGERILQLHHCHQLSLTIFPLKEKCL